MVTRILITLSLSIMTVLSFTQICMAATVQVSLDRNPVVINESFTTTFEADGSVDGEPDFSPLQKDFNILNRSQSNNMQIINGSISRKSAWTVVLMAKREGTLLLPAIHFGNDRSQEVAVIVKPASQHSSTHQEDIFLEVAIEPETDLYVQAQLIYTVRLFRAVDISQASLTEPKAENAIIQKLGEDKSYKKQLQGRHYIVTERSYAIFPQQSGQLTITPLTFQAQILQGNYFGRTRQLHSREVVVEVYPKAAAFPGHATWLPAKDVKLEESWPDNVLKVGEAVTRSIKLQVTGLTSAQIADFNMPLPDGLKQYPDQPVLSDRQSADGVTGIRELKVAIMPTQAGSFTLPEITIPWWNVQEHRLEHARIPARTVQVQAAASQPAQLQSNQPKLIDTETLETAASTDTESGNSPLWFWLTITFAVAWLFTLAAWWWSRREVGATADETPQHDKIISRKVILKELKDACLNNRAKETEISLRSYFAAAPEINRLAKGDAGFQQASQKLQASLYSSEGGNWSGKELWSAVEQLEASSSLQRPDDQHLLPLHPQG